MRCHLLSSDLLARAVEDVLDLKVEFLGGAETTGALGLVADGKVEVALLVDTVLADGVVNVVEHVVLGDPALGLAEARGDVVHGVGGGEGELALVEDVLALGGVDVLVVHGDATALLGVLGGRLAKAKVVPGIVGDVVSTAGGVDLEEIDGAALVGDLDADVVAVNGTGPVGDAVGVDLAAKNSNAAGVLVVGSDAGRAGLTTGERAGRNQGSRSSSKDGGELGEHADGVVEKKLLTFHILWNVCSYSGDWLDLIISQRTAERGNEWAS